MPANADSKPPRIERWVARTSLHAALAREAPTVANPVADDNSQKMASKTIRTA